MHRRLFAFHLRLQGAGSHLFRQKLVELQATGGVRGEDASLILQ